MHPIAKSILWFMALGLAACSTPQTPSAWLYVNTASGLYQVAFGQGQADRWIGLTQNAQGQGVRLLDIALNPTNGQLYGVNDTLYSVNPNNATVQAIGNGLNVLGPGPANETVALAFSKAGVLYAGLGGGALAVINTTTGQGQLVGWLGNNHAYSGDLAFAPDGRLLATVTGPNIYDELWEINPQTGQGTPIGDIGYRKVFGLQFVGAMLYGFTEGNPSWVIAINPATGQGQPLRQLAFAPWGAQ